MPKKFSASVADSLPVPTTGKPDSMLVTEAMAHAYGRSPDALFIAGLPRDFTLGDLRRRRAKAQTHKAAILKAREGSAVTVAHKPLTTPPIAAYSSQGETVPATATMSMPKIKSHAADDAGRSTVAALSGEPRIVLPTVKAFATPQAAYNAGMATMAGVSRAVGRRHSVSESYCQRRGIAPLEVFNAAISSDSTKGGYLVQDELSAAIIAQRTRAGVARKLAFVSPMASDHQLIPWETDSLSVRYVGQAPFSGPTPSDIGWGSVNLTAEKRAVMGYVSQELEGDALVAYTDRYVDRVAHALAKQEDLEFVLADGTSDYGGEVGLLASLGAGGKYAAATGHDTWPELTVADFAGCMAKLPEKFADGRESWICSSAFYAIGMLGAVNGAAQGFAEDGRPLFLGKPVNLMPGMPATTAASQLCCLYGSWTEAAAIGDRGLRYAASDKGPGCFDRDLIAVAAFSRYDINCFGGGDATNAGSYVGLVTAS